MTAVDVPTVIAIVVYSAIAITISATILHTLLWVKKEWRDTKEALLDKANIKEGIKAVLPEIRAELETVITNDVQHMIGETMEGMFVTYAPRMQKAFMVGAEEVARPIMQEAMDAMGEGISNAIGGVITEVLRHEGAQQFGKQGGIAKVTNAQIREGKKQFILKAVEAKAGPMVAGVVANMGLDEEFLELQESNPELAAMIVKNLAEGQTSGASHPARGRPSHGSGSTGGSGNW